MRWLEPTAVYPIVGPYGADNVLLARDGSLLMFVESEGRDPDGLSADDVLTTSLTARTALLALPVGFRLQTYYWHARAILPTPRVRGHQTIDGLEAARAQHLSAKSLYRTRLLNIVALPTLAASRAGDLSELLTGVFLAPFDRRARQMLARAFSRRGQQRYVRSVLDDGLRRLTDAVDAYVRRLGAFANARVTDQQRAFAWARSLAQLSVDALERAEPAPADEWPARLLHGRVSSCQVDGTEFLKVDAGASCYARVASLIRFGASSEQGVTPGFWLAEPSPLNVRGDFLIACNARSLSGVEEGLAFTQAESALHRATFSFRRALAQGAPHQRHRGAHRVEPSAELDELTAGLKEIHGARRLSERWMRAQYTVFAVGDTPTAIRDTALALDTALSLQSVTPVWETPGVLDCYRSMQPGAAPFEPRAHLHNATQVAALGLHYRTSNGPEHIELLGGEEPQILLESVDGSVFAYSPFVGEKATVIGCGPSRSGKTFAKNVINAHWAKWGGLLACLDYDDGSECLTHLFGGDAALVTGEAGMNPFAAEVADTSQFQAHLTRLALRILSANDDPAMQKLADGEQRQLDLAIERALALPTQMRTLSALVAHMPPTLAEKFARWTRDQKGRYAALLDSNDDQVGVIARKVTAFALRAMRDDPAARGPVTQELLWRITSAFEDPARRALPKKLVIDEAHYELRNPQGAAYLATKARTWPKYLASLELWSQHVHEYGDASDWQAIRGAASVFLFTANPEAETDSYRAVFGLTDADVETVRTLVPKRELYLVQPDTTLRKRLILDADPAARIWASSTATLAARRQALAAEHGFEGAIARLNAELGYSQRSLN